jgi:hypothetical protein
MGDINEVGLEWGIIDGVNNNKLDDERLRLIQSILYDSEDEESVDGSTSDVNSCTILIGGKAHYFNPTHY